MRRLGWLLEMEKKERMRVGDRKSVRAILILKGFTIRGRRSSNSI